MKQELDNVVVEKKINPVDRKHWCRLKKNNRAGKKRLPVPSVSIATAVLASASASPSLSLARIYFFFHCTFLSASTVFAVGLHAKLYAHLAAARILHGSAHPYLCLFQLLSSLHSRLHLSTGRIDAVAAFHALSGLAAAPVSKQENHTLIANPLAYLQYITSVPLDPWHLVVLIRRQCSRYLRMAPTNKHLISRRSYLDLSFVIGSPTMKRLASTFQSSLFRPSASPVPGLRDQRWPPSVAVRPFLTTVTTTSPGGPRARL